MKYRSPAVSLFLSLIVPFYTYYWWYDTTKRLEAKSIAGVPSIMPVFSVIVIYAALIVGSNLHMAAGRSTETNPPTSLYIAIGLIPLIYILTIVFAYRFVKAANQMVTVTIKPALMTAIFFALPPAGIYIYQKQFNMLLDADSDSTPKPPTLPRE